MSEKAIEKHVERVAALLGEQWAERQYSASCAAAAVGGKLIPGETPNFRAIAAEKLWERMARIAAREIEQELQ